MIKQYIHRQILNRAYLQTRRKVQMLNMDSIHSVGILTNPGNSKELNEYEQVVQLFQNIKKKVFPYIYIDKKAEIILSADKKDNLVFLTKANFNWLGKPKAEDELFEFQNKEFDILIDLSFSPIFGLQYLFVASKAHLKISPIAAFGESYSDFTLSIPAEQGKDFFVKEIIRYLQIINKTKK